MPVSAAFIKDLLSDPEFRRELEEEDRRKWEAFTVRLLEWDGESEELPGCEARAIKLSKTRSAESWSGARESLGTAPT
jgi:hypothetical protein